LSEFAIRVVDVMMSMYNYITSITSGATPEKDKGKSTSPVDSASTKKGSSKSGDDRSDDDVESDSDASAESDIQIIPGPEGKDLGTILAIPS